jgi:hypothetical protein
MSELADVFAVLQQLDYATLSRVTVEVHRILQEKQNESRERVDLPEPASLNRGRL